MPDVKVRRKGISAGEAGDKIRAALGPAVTVTPGGEHRLDVSQGFFVRARVEMTEEPGGTVFSVRGAGVPFPLVYIVTRVANEKRIAARVAEALGANEDWA